jgi:rifampicin phosphotransferase
MSKPLFIRYDQKRFLKPHWIGLKAARLVQLHQHGLPVPPFVIMPAYTIKEFLNTPGQSGSLRSLWFSFFTSWRRAWGDTAKFAVRSSGAMEDSEEFSFAGQFESVLSLTDNEEIWAAILHCLDSGKNALVHAYMGPNKSNSSAFALMIQLMIPATYSGVMFTQHPVTGQSGIMLEFVQGLSDNLTAGQENPGRCFLDQFGDAVAESVDQCNDWPSVLKHLLPSLVAFAHTIERLFIVPQDIEWAITQDRVWILQARPITTMPASEHVQYDSHRNAYTDYFFVERFAAPPSPMGWSLLKPLIEKNAFREPLWFLGFDEWAKSKQVTQIFDGYPYTALTVMQLLYSGIPLRFISRDKKNQLLLYKRQKPWWLSLLRSVPFLCTRLLAKNLLWLPFFHLHKWKIFYERCRYELADIKQARNDGNTFSQMLALLDRTKILSDEFLSLHRWSITFADLYYELLLKYIKLRKPRFDILTVVHELLSGLEDNQTVLANRYLAHLASLPGRPDEHQELWQRFFEQFGHRSESLDIAVPTWNEKRDTIDSLVRHLALNFQEQEKHSLSHAQHKRALAHKECFAHINKRNGLIPAFIHRSIYHYLMSRGQIFALLRENQRDIWHRILSQSRQLVLAISDYAIQRQWLNEREDIFNLKVEELSRLPQDKARPELYKKIAARRQQTPRSGVPVYRPPGKDEPIIYGLGVSHGLATGNAFIAQSYEEALTVPKNAILITRSIDPAWTPVFHSIAGLVLEVGGVLSHASILAREFGVPTVTGVTLASQRIASGTRLRIDGTKGHVIILDEHDD